MTWSTRRTLQTRRGRQAEGGQRGVVGHAKIPLIPSCPATSLVSARPYRTPGGVELSWRSTRVTIPLDRKIPVDKHADNLATFRLNRVLQPYSSASTLRPHPPTWFVGLRTASSRAAEAILPAKVRWPSGIRCKRRCRKQSQYRTAIVFRARARPMSWSEGRVRMGVCGLTQTHRRPDTHTYIHIRI